MHDNGIYRLTGENITLAEIMKEEDLDDRVHSLFYWKGRLDAVPVAPLSFVARGLRPQQAGDRTPRAEN